jgi:hypothetical protein
MENNYNKPMRKLTTIILLFACLAVQSATYYVAPSGGSDGNPGTIGSPWATWQHAFLTAQAGDIVYFRGGVWYPSTLYSGNNVCLIRPDASIGHRGAPGNPICYYNYPGETPILDCRNIHTPGAFSTALQIEDAQWLNFKGLTIRNLYQRVQDIEVGAIRGEAVSNLNWENMVIYNIGGHGWYMESDVGIEYQAYDLGWDGSGYIPYDTTSYKNCDTYNCCDTFRVNPGNHVYNMGDGFKHINGGAYVCYEGCRAWHCCDDGFDMPGYGVTIMKNCWSFANGWQSSLCEGNGFKFGANDREITTPRKILLNCLAAYNQPATSGVGFGELEYGEYRRCMSRIYNCTSYKNNVGFMISDGGTSYPNSESIYRNNIVYGTTGRDAGSRPDNFEVVCLYTESNNTWDYGIPGSLPRWIPTDTVTVSDADFVSVDSTGITGARQADYSLPDINFLKLTTGSDLIDKGTTKGRSEIEKYKGIGLLTYNDSAPDIGYAEYGTSVPPNIGPGKILKYNGKIVMYNGKIVKY